MSLACDTSIPVLAGQVACLEELLSVQEQVVRDQTRRLKEEQERLRAAEAEASANASKARRILDMACGAVVCLDGEGRIGDWSRSAEQTLGLVSQDRGQVFWEKIPVRDQADRLKQWHAGRARGDGPEKIDMTWPAPDGRPRLLEFRVSFDNIGEGCLAILFGRDITDERRREQISQQSQKLESVGRLAAGIAHEINTPVQFVSDSVNFIGDAIRDLTRLVGIYHDHLAAALDGTTALPSAAELAELERDADLEFLLTELPNAIQTSRDGLSRVATIVRSMKEFAHPDHPEKTDADLNRSIESTLGIARNEYKYVADLETEFGNLPPVPCYVGEFNQAVLNILVNAAQAIGDMVEGTDQRGIIRVKTRALEDCAEVVIEDTGPGIPEGIRDRVFDHFFTTKPVGHGTGQGLAIARSIIVEKHKGELSFATEVGKGTTFTIRLPFEWKEPRDVEERA
ncbi:MAG: ATP-binding protein [Candidatus Zixiibacteriota bacterium]